MKAMFELMYGLACVAVMGYYVLFPLIQSQDYAAENQISYETVIVNACSERIVCPQFKEARDSCAIANDFDKCVNIKMAGKGVYFCRADGGSNKLDAINVNPLFCYATKFAWWAVSLKNK